MFKRLSALMRGAAWDAAEDITDRNAVVILDQQIRDCSRALGEARKAVAFAQAQSQQEASQCNVVSARLEELETRTLAALEAGKNDLACDAAEMIACLEADKASSLKAQAEYEREILRLRATVSDAASRLAALKRGQRVAVATDRVQKLKSDNGHQGIAALHDAEQTLHRLKVRQTQADVMAAALSAELKSDNPEGMIGKLAEAGCGNPLKPSADDVLARLTERVGQQARSDTTTAETSPTS